MATAAGFLVLLLGACGGEEAGPACDGGDAFLPTASFEGTIVDPTRGRELRYVLRYAPSAAEPSPVVVVSHGGPGATEGHRVLAHLGTEYAGHGYVALHLNHPPSASVDAHLRDRPADVSFVLTALENGSLPRPPDLSVDAARVAHVGHSYGAYTAHAVGGATFDHGTFRDERVRAIVPISPQGPGQLGAFDRGPLDNSWRTVNVPSYVLVGGAEKDGSFGDTPPIVQTDWRLSPFRRYPPTPERYISVLPAQTHTDMQGGSPEVNAYVARNSRVFLDAHLRGEAAARCCVGQLSRPTGTDVDGPRPVVRERRARHLTARPGDGLSRRGACGKLRRGGDHGKRARGGEGAGSEEEGPLRGRERGVRKGARGAPRGGDRGPSPPRPARAGKPRAAGGARADGGV